MPARSNDFQKLVHQIYRQVAPTASVQESAALKERGTGTPREVDVLVETKIAGSEIRLAVECRDHSRASDIEWIDGLIGKYRDLPVNKVIAVSRSGFTQAARDKALANLIEPRTLVKALETDWPLELEHLGIGGLSIEIRTINHRARTDPRWPSPDRPEIVELQDGTQVSYARFEELVRDAVVQTVSDDFFKRVVAPGKPVASAAEPYRIWVDTELEGITFIALDQQRHNLLKLAAEVSVTPTLWPVAVTRELYGEVGVSSGTIETPTESFRVTAVQAPHQQGVVQISKVAIRTEEA